MKIISLVKMYRKAPAGWMANQPVRVCRIDDYYQVMYLHMYSIIHARLTIRKLQGHHQKTLAQRVAGRVETRTNSHFRRIRPCSSSCFFLDIKVIKNSDDVLAGVGGGVAKCHPLQLAVAWIYISNSASTWYRVVYTPSLFLMGFFPATKRWELQPRVQSGNQPRASKRIAMEPSFE